MLHVCDCSNCGEACVPITLNDNVNPLFLFATLCCRLLSDAPVAFNCEIGTGKVKDQSMVGAGIGRVTTFNSGLSMPLKFAALIPEPASAAITSSRLVLRPELTSTANTI